MGTTGNPSSGRPASDLSPPPTGPAPVDVSRPPTEPADDPPGVHAAVDSAVAAAVNAGYGKPSAADVAILRTIVVEQLRLAGYEVRALVDGQPAPTPDPSITGDGSGHALPNLSHRARTDQVDLGGPATPGRTREQVRDALIEGWHRYPKTAPSTLDGMTDAVLSLFGSACAPEPPAGRSVIDAAHNIIRRLLSGQEISQTVRGPEWWGGEPGSDTPAAVTPEQQAVIAVAVATDGSTASGTATATAPATRSSTAVVFRLWEVNPVAEPVLPAGEVAEPGRWQRLNEALDLAQKPLREDFEWLVGEHESLRGLCAAETERADDHLAAWKRERAEVESLRATVARLRTAAGDLARDTDTMEANGSCIVCGAYKEHMAACSLLALRAALDDPATAVAAEPKEHGDG